MKNYLTNYYYIHPKKIRHISDSSLIKPPVISLSPSSLNQVAVQSQPPIEQTNIGTNTLQNEATQTMPKLINQQVAAKSIDYQTQTLQVNKLPLITIPKRKAPSKAEILIELFCQIAFEMGALQGTKKSIIREQINYYSVFQLLGSQGWEWISDEQFKQGINKLEIECKPYQIQMLFCRLTGTQDFLQFSNFQSKLLKPIQIQQTQKALEEKAFNKPILKPEKLRKAKQLIKIALDIQYYVFLIKELMVSEDWNSQTILRILRGQKTMAQACDLHHLQLCLKSSTKQNCLYLFFYLCDNKTQLITSESIKQFLLFQ